MLARITHYPGGITALIRDYCDARMAFLRSLTGKNGFGPNGRGWTIRVTGVDLLGKYKPKAGVVGNAVALASGAATTGKLPVVVEGGEELGRAKANPSNIGLSAILDRPEAIAPVAAGLSSVGAVASGEGPFQYALAFLVVVLVLGWETTPAGGWPFDGRPRPRLRISCPMYLYVAFTNHINTRYSIDIGGISTRALSPEHLSCSPTPLSPRITTAKSGSTLSRSSGRS